jgi:hypothetical protein
MARTLAGLLISVLGGALLGAVVGMAVLTIFIWRGAPGGTGMEILVVPALVVSGAVAGGCAGAAGAFVRQTGRAWADRFVVVALVAIALHAIVSFLAYAAVRAGLSTAFVSYALSNSGPVLWRRLAPDGLGGMVFNLGWLYTLPITLFLCSRYFRHRFFG